MKSNIKVTYSRIDMVFAHTTSTPAGDGVEYMTITDKFGDIPIYAPSLR